MDGVVELLGIGHLLDRRPALLSGGEKQRVAIGRALLASPRLLLMDEPLASLDEARKAEILPYIERLRDETGIPIVYVSHSVAEVARLATTSWCWRRPGRRRRADRGRSCSGSTCCRRRSAARAARCSTCRCAATTSAFGMTVLASAAGEIRVPRLRCPTGATRAGAHPGPRRDDRHRAAAGPQRAQHPAGNGCRRSAAATARLPT